VGYIKLHKNEVCKFARYINNHWIRFLVKKGLAIMVKIVRIFK